ncbi:MAG: ribonuclease HII [Cellulomonadaceae bacterium]|jgi:ribonuclease HII|nr:ribonuclease HII [Cellulomonadaceae bacterium]
MTRVTLDQERAILNHFPPGTALAGMDEVGRGSLAGPVGVGVAVVTALTPDPPGIIADSKALSAARRHEAIGEIHAWAAVTSVGYASSQEIDEWGMTRALRIAGSRALVVVEKQMGAMGAILLDGSHNWLGDDRVTLQVKADQQCASVAAASIVAKVDRDALMVDAAREYPEYGWERNKGYGTAVHRQAIREHGLSPHHRRSWRISGVNLQ